MYKVQLEHGKQLAEGSQIAEKLIHAIINLLQKYYDALSNQIANGNYPLQNLVMRNLKKEDLLRL